MASQEEQNLIKKNFENQSSQQENDFCMVVKDGANILGYSNGIIPHESLAVITDLYILPSERGLGFGDGLLRATFNSLELNGSKWVLIEGKDGLRDFLVHEDLCSLEQAPKSEEFEHVLGVWQKNLDRRKYFYCEPKEFFSRKCKGSKKV